MYFILCLPSHQGLMSHVFHTPGVYYYSDQNYDEAAEYIGTVIVKPKPREHQVELKGKGFHPGEEPKNTMGVRFGLQFGQDGIKWDKPGTF